MEFARGPLARSLASPSGRLLRSAAGLGLIFAGRRVGGLGGVLIATIGLVPLAAGSFDFCLVSRLAGGPLMGREIREYDPNNEPPRPKPFGVTRGEISSFA